MYFWCGLIGHVCMSGHVFLQLSSSLTSILQDNSSWQTDGPCAKKHGQWSSKNRKRDSSCTYTGHSPSHYWECYTSDMHQHSVKWYSSLVSKQEKRNSCVNIMYNVALYTVGTNLVHQISILSHFLHWTHPTIKAMHDNLCCNVSIHSCEKIAKKDCFNKVTGLHCPYKLSWCVDLRKNPSFI